MEQDVASDLVVNLNQDLVIRTRLNLLYLGQLNLLQNVTGRYFL